MDASNSDYGLWTLVVINSIFFILFAARVCGHSCSPNDSCTQTDERRKAGCQLVVAGCDAPKLFDAAKPAFDQIAVAVKVLVEGPRMLARGVRGNDDRHAAFVQGVDQMGGIVSRVGHDGLHR